MKTCPLEEKRDPPCARQVALFPNDPRKERDPPCTGKEAAKAANIVISPTARQVAPSRGDPRNECDPLCTGQEAAKAANPCISLGAKQVAPIWDPGSWSYWEPIWYRISLSQLAKSETLVVDSFMRSAEK